MRRFLGWTVTAVLGLAACGGKVTVDLPGGAGGTGGAGGVAMTTTSISGVGGFNTSTSSGVFDGAGGSCVTSCAEAITNGGVPCGGAALSAYQQLQACACTSAGVCSSNADCGQLCQSGPVDPSCGMCLAGNCGMSFTECSND